MREYRIREGSQYAGTHLIYENEEEFQKYIDNPAVKLHKWAVDDFQQYQVGDYVIAEDGYIVQILAIREMKTKKERIGKTVFIRFPMGTFAVYERADGTIHYPRFYAQFTTGDKGSAAGRSRSNFTGSKDEAKKRFASLLYNGIDKWDAYRIAFNHYHYLTPSQIEGKITRLLRDESVVSELRILLQPQQEKLKEVFPDEVLINHIQKLLDKCKKGSPQHRKNIELVLALRGLI